MEQNCKGHLILLMAPTGSGKGVLQRHILQTFSDLQYAISCTTRAPRPAEKEGVDYHFVTEEKFKQCVELEEFLEWATFGGNLYGTLKSEVVERLRAGEVVLNEIELQGVEALKKLIPTEHISVIYIDAGDWETLAARARARAAITEEELALRKERFLIESQWRDYADYVVDNKDGALKSAKKQIVTIVESIFKHVKHNGN
jgi:guanylate kinase